jgi:small-conductance mechanosensitive channel
MDRPIGTLMRRRPGLLPRLAPGLLLCLAWLPANAEDVAASPASNAEIEAVPQAEIPARAVADERYVREVIERAARTDGSDALGGRLDVLARGVRDLAPLFKRDELLLLPVVRLESLERHWNFYERQLADWSGELQRATSTFSEDAAELARRRAAWEATRAGTMGSELAPALDERARTVLAQITLAEQAISAPLDRLIKLGRRANTVAAGIEAGQKAVAAAIAHNDRRLTRIDSPPIWALWNEPRRSQDALAIALTGLSIERDFLQEFTAANTDRLQLRALFAVALLPLLVWLSARSRRLVSEDPELKASAQVLLRPISSWLVLVLVGTIVLEPEAPIIVQEVALLLVLIPVLRLLPREVYAAMGWWPYVATGLYVLHRLGFVFMAHPFYHRLHLLAVTLLTLVSLAWLLLQARRKHPIAPTIGLKIVRLFGWASVACLGVSAVANFAGNSSLAEMLTSAVLDSGYVGLVLYAGVTVLGSVLRVLLARRAVSQVRIVTQYTGPLLKTVGQLLRVAALVIWVLVVLSQFRIYRPIYQAVVATLTHEFGYGELSLTLGAVLLFAVSVYLAFWVARTVRMILQDEILPKMPLPRGVGSSVSSLTYYALVMFGIFVALAAAGFEISQLAIVIGALGVGIGFGLQNVVNNFVSGLILMFERPIQPGDVVEVSGTSGKVREIGMRATTLTTFEGADVVVPNGMLLNEKLINWTLSDMDRRIDVNVGVAYGSDPRRVVELLMEVTKATPGVAAEPEPAILFTGFGASSLDFGVRAWTNEFGEWVRIRTELTMRVYEALRDAGIEIPFPQQVLHLRSVAPDAGAMLAGQRPPEAPADDPAAPPEPA